MLTKEHGIAEYKGNRIIPDRLIRKLHANYPGYAEQMVKVYTEGKGKTRRELHRKIQHIFRDEPDCPAKRIDAFCKLLDDQYVFQRDISGKAANLRKKVFRMAAASHPLVQSIDRLFENSETEVKEKIANELKIPWQEIEDNLFADVPDYHRLQEFKGFEKPGELLSRYNVGQLQVALFGAVEMTVQAGDGFKTILRYAKLAKLMHTIERLTNNRFSFKFNGPASVLRNTRRYGVAMAKFLPSLICCQNWEMRAKITTKWKGKYNLLNLSHRDNFKSHLPSEAEFDSSIEKGFAEKWGEEKRDGWRLTREGDILWKGQKVFFPDFVLEHDDGRRFLMEIVGFWTPQYLKEKVKTLEAFKEYNILLAVSESVEDKIPTLPMPVITYKTALNMKDVLEFIEAI